MAVRVGWVERAGALAQAREAHRAALCPSGGPRDALAAPPHRSAHPTRPSISDGWVGLNRLAERVGHTVARSLRERVRGPPHLGRPSSTELGERRGSPTRSVQASQADASTHANSPAQSSFHISTPVKITAGSSFSADTSTFGLSK